jgi:hypothetical protein
VVARCRPPARIGNQEMELSAAWPAEAAVATIPVTYPEDLVALNGPVREGPLPGDYWLREHKRLFGGQETLMSARGYYPLSFRPPC